MSIRDELSAELKGAMKQRDQARVNVIRQIQTEISVAKTAPGFTGDVDDDLYQRTIAAYVKKMDRAREEYEAAGERGRQQADKLTFEIEYLSQWLPTQLDEEETRALVKATIADMGVDDQKAAGAVIGRIMKSDHQVDGALVARIVREELGA